MESLDKININEYLVKYQNARSREEKEKILLKSYYEFIENRSNKSIRDAFISDYLEKISVEDRDLKNFILFQVSTDIDNFYSALPYIARVNTTLNNEELENFKTILTVSINENAKFSLVLKLLKQFYKVLNNVKTKTLVTKSASKSIFKHIISCTKDAFKEKSSMYLKYLDEGTPFDRYIRNCNLKNHLDGLWSQNNPHQKYIFLILNPFLETPENSFLKICKISKKIYKIYALSNSEKGRK